VQVPGFDSQNCKKKKKKKIIQKREVHKDVNGKILLELCVTLRTQLETNLDVACPQKGLMKYINAHSPSASCAASKNNGGLMCHLKMAKSKGEGRIVLSSYILISFYAFWSFHNVYVNFTIHKTKLSSGRSPA
jgi:hypothetical protein